MINTELIAEVLLGYVVILIPAIVILGIVLLAVLRPEKNLARTVQGNLRLWRGKLPVMILCGLLFFAVCAGKEVLRHRLASSVTINYNYPEASVGQNPNGTKFTAMNDILSDEVMNELIAACGLENMTAEELRKGFKVTPININEAVSLEQPYVATEYVVRYEASFDRPNVRPQKIMEEFSEIYREFFASTYAMNTSALNLDFGRLEDVDYLDVTTILSSMATNLQVYLSECGNENRSFVSEATGESFSSLNQKLSNFIDIAMENYWAFVLKNGISNDKSQYIGKLNYDNRNLNTDYRKSLALYQIYLEAVEMYQRDLATIVLVPTRDENGEFYMSRTKLGVDDFSQGAENASANASNLALEIEGNNHTIRQLQQNNADNFMVAEAEEMIASLKTELSALSEAAVETIKEYEEKSSNNYIAIVAPELKGQLVSILMAAAKQTVMFLALVVLLILFMPEKSGRKGREGKR